MTDRRNPNRVQHWLTRFADAAHTREERRVTVTEAENPESPVIYDGLERRNQENRETVRP